MPDTQRLDGELTMTIEGQAVGAVANNLTTDVEGYALDARQGKVLNDTKLDKSKVVNNLGIIAEGYALDARQGKYLDETKLGFSDIANDLITSDVNKVLSAAQAAGLNGRLKLFEDAIGVTDTVVDIKGKYLDNALFR